MKPPRQLLLEIESPTGGPGGKLVLAAGEPWALPVSEGLWGSPSPRKVLNNGGVVGSCLVDDLFYL